MGLTMYLFQASFADAEGRYRGHDFNTAEEAATAVETAGDGSVVKFKKEKNMPGCLPEYRLFSLCLWTFENGKWDAKGIHGPSAFSMGEERPK